MLEVGPGRGGLTAALLERAGRVVAIEKDRELVPELRARFPNATIVEGDALDVDWRAAAGPRLLVTGNIPYNITSPLIDKALEPPRPERIVFLVQLEVAERVTARPATPEYGALSVGIQTSAVVELLFRVPAGAFNPRPKVESMLLRLRPLAAPPVAHSERASFRRMVVGLFGFRRKQLLRGLRELTGWGPGVVAQVLTRSGLERTLRPEAVSPAEFVVLHRALVDGGWRAG